MNLVQIIATLRKFGNYLAGLFPVLVVVVDFFSKLLRKLVENPLVAPHWEMLSKNKTVLSGWKFCERFYWRTYSKDRLDLEQAPPETVLLLRPVFQLCALLCVLIPVTQFPFHQVEIEAFSGFKGSAPGWSVLLWLISLPFAWAALLVGTAMSNRIAFAITSAAAAWLLTTCVVLLPRSYFNVLAPIGILIALGYCERVLKTDGKAGKVLSVANALVAGTAAGIPLLILTPLRPILGQISNLPGPVISIGGGAFLGSALGMLALVWARLPNKPDRPFLLRGAVPNMGAVVWTVILCLLVFLLAGIVRGSLGQSGGLVITSLALTNGYLWPIWYFIGVGILHKLMGSSKVVASAIEGMFPSKILTPLLVLTLMASTVVAFSEKIAYSLSFMKGATAESLLPLFFQIYMWSKPFIWSSPFNTMAVHWLSWVLLFDVVVVVVLIFQKRLTSAAVARLLFLTSLSGLLICEYVFQMSSFLRTPTHSMAALFFFAIWLLWLMHTVGWGLSSRSSPLWPSAGRLAVYSGIAMIAILDIHARSACKDFKLMNELFLTMFRGVIDVGLPYYFLVWTSRRVETLPVKISTMLGVFSLGALTSFAFNILEKLAAAGWSVNGLQQLVETQRNLMQSVGSVDIDLDVPVTGFLVRAVLYVALISILYFAAKKKTAGTTDGAKTFLFLFVAFASGIASFSRTLIELPLPADARALIAPTSQELLFNCNLFQSYLAYWIPALLLGYTQLVSRGSTRMFLLMAPPAMTVHFLISWLCVDRELFLRASDSMYSVIAMLGGIFVVLTIACIQFLSKAEKTQTSATLLTPRALLVLVGIAEVIFLAVGIVQSRSLSFEERNLTVFPHPVSIAGTWQQSDEQSNTTVVTMTRKSAAGGISMLQMGTVESDPKGTRELLKKLVESAAQSPMYPNLSVISVESWSKYCPGAVACSFSYELPGTKPAMTMSGISALVPREDGRTEFYTLHTNPHSIARETWEMAQVVKASRKLGGFD